MSSNSLTASGTAQRQQALASELAVFLLIGAELMVFAGLLSGYLVFRASVSSWPPAGQPRLPVAATAVNTALLCTSLALLWFRSGPVGRTRQAVILALGAAFVVLQGREWLALLAQGLSLSQGPFGAFFTLIIGAHALHCVAGLAWLAVAFAMGRPQALRLAGLFWAFVVLLWPALYAIVYLW